MRGPQSEGMFVYKESGSSGLVLSCEHASADLPSAIRPFVPSHLIEPHRLFDMGAARLSMRFLKAFGGYLVAGRWSRLFCDLNRGEEDRDCVPARVDGVELRANLLEPADREARIRLAHRPYHEALDGALQSAGQGSRPVFLFSVHSFSPVLGKERREVEAGVLFCEHEALATKLIQQLTDAGFVARGNEPYSGLSGMVYSARRHGQAHSIPYLELEIRNDFLSDCRFEGTCGRIVPVLECFLQENLQGVLSP